jgi:hypothetical protein
MPAWLPVRDAPGVVHDGAAVGRQPSPVAVSLVERLLQQIVGAALRLTANQRLSVSRDVLLASVRATRVTSNTAALIHTNNGKDLQVLRFKFERISGGIPPLSDSRLFLTSSLNDPTTWVPAGPRRPIVGWPLDNMDERLILLRPGENVFYCSGGSAGAVGPGGWLYWSLLDSNDPSLVR